MKVAALDLGSNTFLCLIASRNSSGQLQIHEDQTEVVRLGQGLAKTGNIDTEALVRANQCLQRYALLIQKHQPDKVLAVATAAARKASNGAELIKIAENNKIPIKVISGIEEAELTFKGTISHLPNPERSKLIIDIGGASTEIIVGSISKGITYKKSFEIGVVKLKEAFVSHFPIDSSIILKIKNEIKRVFSEIETENWGNDLDIIAVAGTPTTLAAAAIGQFDPVKVEGFQFSSEELKHWSEKLMLLTPKEIESQFGVSSGRSDVLFVGNLILSGVLEAIKGSKLKVSVRGLRYGVAMSLL